MDLYEALKNGTSAEELLNAFHKDLDDATARIAAEAAEAELINKQLSYSRSNLAEAVANYSDALGEKMGADFEPLPPEEVEKILIAFEKEMKETLSLSKHLDNFFKKNKREEIKKPEVKTVKFCNSDDDIIDRFLKNLK